MLDRFPRLRGALRMLAIAAAFALAATWLSTDHFRAFGGSPGARDMDRIRASPRWVRDHFENAEPTGVMKEGRWEAMWGWLSGPEMRSPPCPLPLAFGRPGGPPLTGLRITWLGHSTTLIEIDGSVVLTDPVWSERASPSTWVGPRRFHRPPIPLAELPRIDAVVISHEHYDHLDMETVRALSAKGAVFHVPLGVGAHLAVWGVPDAQVVEHDWWEPAKLEGGVSVISTPARHFNGRGVPWRAGALWSSWSIVGPRHRVFFSGDTGMTDAFRDIAAREGPFDVAMLEIGQYHPSWGDIHLGPVGALDAFALLHAKKLLPIHWATFQLGLHAWSEPAETLFVEAQKRGVRLLLPELGESVEPAAAPAPHPWWRALPPIASRCP